MFVVSVLLSATGPKRSGRFCMGAISFQLGQSFDVLSKVVAGRGEALVRRPGGRGGVGAERWVPEDHPKGTGRSHRGGRKNEDPGQRPTRERDRLSPQAPRGGDQGAR